MKSKICFPILLLFFPLLTLAQTSSLQGKWSFLTLMENGENITLPESSKNNYLDFAKNSAFSSSITCNGIGGKYLLGSKGKIKFSSLLMTMKACFGEKSKVEHSFGNVLKRITRYQIKGSILILQDERGMNVVTLTKYKEPKENIQGKQIK